MFLPMGLTFVLTVMVSCVNGRVYTFLDMSEAKPYDQIRCGESCGKPLTTTLTLLPKLVGWFLQEVSFRVDFCQECKALNLPTYTFEHKCFMNSEKNIFDHHLAMKFPKFGVRCKCDLPNNASAAAKTINRVKAIRGQCGMEKYENLETCKPLECNGNQGGEGQSTVKLLAKLPDAKISVILRIDTRYNSGDAYPILMSLSTNSDIPVTHEGPSAFGEAGKCLEESQDGLTCRLLGNLATPFFGCLDSSSTFKFIGSMLYAGGKC